jgi:hypothetical protein
MRSQPKGRIPSRVFRTIFNYTLIAAAVLAASSLALAAVGAPPWLLRTIGLTLFLAFPFVLVLAWALSAEPREGARPKPWDMRPELSEEKAPPPRSRIG